MISPNNACVYFNTPLPQQDNLTQSESSEKTNLTNVSQSGHGKSWLSPPCYHSSGESFAVTPVEQMTVDQTANWIMTLGQYHGWAETELYAESFRNQSITGAILKELTPEMLEFSLGMRNHQTQKDLLSAIQHLYPNTKIRRGPEFEYLPGIQVVESLCGSVCKSGQGSVVSDYGSNNSYLVSSLSKCTGKSRQTDYSDMMSMSGYSQRSFGGSYATSDSYFGTASDSYIGSEEFNGPIIGSVRRSQDQMELVMADGKTLEECQEEEDALLRGSKTLRCRKLLLILKDDQVPSDNCAMQSIQARFQELKIQVQVVPLRDKRNTFTLVFPNYQTAEDVLKRADEIGYKLQKKWPPRPNPKRPLKYKSLALLKIRTGKSLNADVVGVLKKGVIVTVNQVKGRRARLIEEDKNGMAVTIGWVSIHEDGGYTLLRQLGDF